jgi:hypothetical protein
VVLGALAIMDDEFELTLELGIHGSVVSVDLFLGKEAGLNAKCKINFLLRIQQGYLADLLEVVLDGVCCSTGRHDLLNRCVVVVGIRVNESRAGGRSFVLGGRSAVLDVVSDFDFLGSCGIKVFILAAGVLSVGA